MNLKELIAAYNSVKGMANTPHAAPLINELRRHLDEIPRQLGLPEKAYKQMKDNPARAKELTELIGSYVGVHPKNLVPDHEDAESIINDAIGDYGDTGYRAINKIFRDPFGPSMSNHRNMQAQVLLDSLQESKNPMVVYRGLPDSKTADSLHSMDLRNELKQYGNKGFMSTSLDPAVARHFSETGNPANNFRIMVPAKTPVLPVHNGVDSSALTGELEYVLPPNSRYSVLPRSGDSNYTDLILSHHGEMETPDYVPDEPGVGWLAGALPLGLLPAQGESDDHKGYAQGGSVSRDSRNDTQPSFSDIVALANTPGPMQGMAQAYLRQISEESEAVDRRTEATGRSHSPASGPAGLNFGDATPGHGSYPAELVDNLINRYGMVPTPPTGNGEEGGTMAPHPKAIEAYNSAMDEFEPSLWDKTKMVGRAIADEPSIALNPLHDLVEYGTPIAGNMRGVKDWDSDFREMYKYATTPRTDGFETMARYGPALTMDLIQSAIPLGWREAPERGVPTMAEMLKKYGGPNIVRPAIQTLHKGLFQ